MPRTKDIARTLFISLTCVWFIHLAGTTVHAQGEAPPNPRRHTGLLIGGAVTFVSSYLATAVAAAMVAIANASDCEAGDIVQPCHDGGLMLIPLAGPFLAHQPLGFQLVLAGPQILGALLAVAGVFHYRSHPHEHTQTSLAVYPVPLPAGAALTATLTF